MSYTIGVSLSQEDKKNMGYEILSTMNIPALEGSEKQIAWANDIRAQLAYHFFGTVCQLGDSTVTIDMLVYKEKMGHSMFYHPEDSECCLAIGKAVLEGITSAEWYIRHKEIKVLASGSPADSYIFWVGEKTAKKLGVDLDKYTI